MKKLFVFLVFTGIISDVEEIYSDKPHLNLDISTARTGICSYA